MPRLAALAVLLALAAPVRAQQPEVRVAADPADVRERLPAEVVPALEETGEAGAAGPGAAVRADELAAIRERLDHVQAALAESEKTNQRTFVLLFLAIIVLIANIIVQQRRK